MAKLKNRICGLLAFDIAVIGKYKYREFGK
jgi:hypothetical protein